MPSKDKKEKKGSKDDKSVAEPAKTNRFGLFYLVARFMVGIMCLGIMVMNLMDIIYKDGRGSPYYWLAIAGAIITMLIGFISSHNEHFMSGITFLVLMIVMTLIHAWLWFHTLTYGVLMAMAVAYVLMLYGNDRAEISCPPFGV